MSGFSHDLAFVVLAMLGLYLTWDLVILPYRRSRRWKDIARMQAERESRRARRGW